MPSSQEIEYKPVLAVDPGKKGGLSYKADAFSDPVVRAFTTESELLDFVDGIDRRSEIVIEDVPVYVSSATSGASSFKLGYNYGFHVGVFRAFRMKVVLVKPRRWQSGIPGLRPNMGYTARKRALKDAACRLFPEVKVTHAVADSLLILDHYINTRP